MNKSKLTKHQFYFTVTFKDLNKLTPIITTYIFLGEKEKEFYFQDALDFQEHGDAFKRESWKDITVLFVDEDGLRLILDINELIVRLDRLKKEVSNE